MLINHHHSKWNTPEIALPKHKFLVLALVIFKIAANDPTHIVIFRPNMYHFIPLLILASKWRFGGDVILASMVWMMTQTHLTSPWSHVWEDLKSIVFKPGKKLPKITYCSSDNILATGSWGIPRGHARRQLARYWWHHVIRRILMRFRGLFINYNSFNTLFFFKVGYVSAQKITVCVGSFSEFQKSPGPKPEIWGLFLEFSLKF